MPIPRIPTLPRLQLALATAAHANDVRVGQHGVYHCPGGQYYANTKRGKFLSESEAVSIGYRAAYNRPCSPTWRAAPATT